MQALANGQLAMYPEYLDTWDTTIAGLKDSYTSRRDAYLAGQHYALKHGLALLNATPFSNTNAIAVTFDYAVENAVQSIPDLIKLDLSSRSAVHPSSSRARPDCRRSKRPTVLLPATFKPLELGSQYTALDQGTVQAAVVQTTDPQLLSGSYPLLERPRRHLRLGQRRAGRVRPRARRRGPGVRGHDQSGQLAAHAVGDPRAERRGPARRSGSGDCRDRVPAGAGRPAAAHDRRLAQQRMR